jgi:hypothetical protein
MKWWGAGMDRINVYIDHFGGAPDASYAIRLRETLLRSGLPLRVTIFSDSPDPEDPSEEDPFWESFTMEHVAESLVVIPLVSPAYLSFVDEPLAFEFGKIIESPDRYLLPIVIESVGISRYPWLLRGKIYPESDALAALHEGGVERVFGDVVKTIENILAEREAKPDKLKGAAELVVAPAVFISHDHDDADFAELLKLKLEKEGLIGWLDSERLKVGQDWREEIDKGLEDALAVVVVMSPEARKSEYVTYEWAYAWGKGKKIFPVLLKETPMHPRLESLQYLDFTNRSARPWDEFIASIKKISDAI